MQKCGGEIVTTSEANPQKSETQNWNEVESMISLLITLEGYRLNVAQSGGPHLMARWIIACKSQMRFVGGWVEISYQEREFSL